ncbi:MAG: chemotaxis protein CheA [Spirochaetae bacterium HGW-Spirochaetae-1]|jgi:two-component system chemotaxis sensor kinase CheA|nr:MAG: chemotaxis protein CheA [Spirochaetae bacterium HGW-Spirochaetae-1]
MGSGKFNLNDALNTFFIESREMLENMESCLLELEKDSTDAESMNALFRSVHTIKGSSGMFGLEPIERFTHIVENILDDVRTGKISVDSDLIGLQLECHDFMAQLLDLFEQNKKAVLSDEMVQKNGYLVERLNSYLGGGNTAPAKEEKIESQLEVNGGEEDQVVSEYWHVSLRFHKDVFKNGLDPQSFINYLSEMGEIKNIISVYDEMPHAEEMNPEDCYLGFEIVFDGSTDKDTLENVFEFVIDDCQLRIIPPRSSIADYVNLIDELPETPMKIGDMLKTVGSLTEIELEKALEMQKEMSGGDDEADRNRFIGEIMVNEKMIQKPVLDRALEKQNDIKRLEEKKKKSIRIDADKLDKLINLIGELVITGANVRQLSERTGDIELNESVSSMSRLIEDVRDSTMNLRMVQIGETFKRYERIVRDLSRERGREIELDVNGGETELDKTLIEKISDPLMHLIRNSIDHGIDNPDDRVLRGKPRKGTVQLNAYYETGSIVIEVIDDGEGLNREKIFNKAVQSGILQADQKISDDDLFQLIFQPGFSTAEQVTNISGRGVGMDVVKKNIESLRGSIIIESEKGVGTTMRIHLPLTLAIVDGFMVKVADSYYVMPLDMVTECSEISMEELAGKEGGNFMNLRGEVLPFMRLREFFREDGEAPTRENIIVLEYARIKAGLVVDKLIGEFQTVIKPLGRLFNNLQWVSGATILGTGDVALILDVPKLVQYIQKIEAATLASVEES